MYGQREAAAIAEAVIYGMKGWDRTQVAIRACDPVSDFVEQEAERLLQRLKRWEPAQYLFNSARFFGNDFEVTPATLIPRPETEMLVDLVVKEQGDRRDLRVLDIGTGSGCIAISLARNLPFSKVTAVDISQEAIAVARRNNERLRTKVNFVLSDIFAPSLSLFDHPYDVIVSNPPYIAQSEGAKMLPNVLRYEPSEALFVPDADPLRFYRAILGFAQTSLASKGKVYLEINPLFANELKKLAASMGFFSEFLPAVGETRPRFMIAES